MSPTLTPPPGIQQSAPGLVADLETIIRNLATASAQIADPFGALTNALAKQTVTAGSTNPTGPKAHPNSDLVQRLRAALEDSYGRLSTGQMITATAGQTVTLTAAATDYMVQQPAHAKGITLYAATHGTPTNGIQAFWSTSIAAAPLNQNGLAYDPNAVGGASYTGAPMIAGTLYTHALSDKAGPLHLASSAAGTVVIVGWLV